MAARALSKVVAQEATEGAVLKVGSSVTGIDDEEESSGGGSFANNLIDGMAEGVVLAAAWFTVRMICQVSYKAIKSYREGKREGNPNNPQLTGKEEEQAFFEVCGEGPLPWDPAGCSTAGMHGHSAEALRQQDDRLWIEELRRASDVSSRDNLRLLDEIKVVGDKIDNLPLEALYDKLRHSMKLLLEYQQNPRFRTAYETLQQAEAAAREVYTNEKSLVMNLSALRIRIVITYLHCPKHSQGQETSMNDKALDKEQCQLYITNALKQGTLETLCRSFLSSRDSEDSKLRERVAKDAVVAFDIILEVLASVYMLEPFTPSQGPLPKDVPDIVIHALSAYCQSGMGKSALYADLARSLKAWQDTPERQDKQALQALYSSTNGPKWACNEGWDTLLETPLSCLYGVTTEGGMVTKICLGANDLDGRLPPELGKLRFLQELSLPGNKLFGRIPKSLWELPSLRVVALHKNKFSATPPANFAPALPVPLSMEGAAGGAPKPPPRRRRCLAGKVEACHPGRIELYDGEWFTCSWKICNSGGLVFPRHTRLSRSSDEYSGIGGAEFVMVNPLRPGEEQVVSVMQQAPNHEAWCKDEWALVGEGLDFWDEDDAKAQTPTITVIMRGSGAEKSADMNANLPTLANTVFVAARQRHRSSTYSSGSSHRYSVSLEPPPPPYSFS
ncbi:Hypothetical leucine rich repeat protein [Ectocarpus siliculosus]|uniref:Hypothetical leucine rich repeat protein n=1 Tax=Ectocarpus siliculosus TaxID=2880 RepID=D7FSP2_ECTSI|nr:Hypothetical leucine rich repeat protein [Ectocarpus siliculosus]|eukprot:CBJ31183.1 Hypothetical leucine rich repeat protein [Ectocarpus siliculosus]